jgi:ABC-2 type transport system permease protein
MQASACIKNARRQLFMTSKRRLTLKQSCAFFLIAYFIIAGILYWIVHESFSCAYVNTDAITAQYGISDLKAGEYVKQALPVQSGPIESISLYVAFQGGSGNVYAELLDEDHVLGSTLIVNDGKSTMHKVLGMLDNPVDSSKADVLRLSILPGQEEGKVTTIGYGTYIDVGKFKVEQTSGLNSLTVRETPVYGLLSYILSIRIDMLAAQLYWPVCVALGGLLAAYCIYACYREKKGKPSLATIVIDMWRHYAFLLAQLISRDFKTKYKRSVLGVLWSFLNPLLTMAVQFIVFSTLFKSSIENFPVYLLSGIIIFNFFSESVGQGMTSIVGNTSLLTKVYIPKYIFPVYKVLSSMVNVVISLLPLLLVMVVTGVHFTKAILLLPVVLFFVMLFSMGMSMLLSAAMVFFRDTQFLWTVLVMLWNFLTPIFYPETIIPIAYRTLYHMNPLYQYVYFMRTIILDGISPAPMNYAYCILASTVMFIIGMYVFKKSQNNFLLYL